MIETAKSLKNTLMCCMDDNKSDTLKLVLEHLKGDVSCVDMKQWLLGGREHPDNLHAALLGLNDECFATAQKVIKASENEKLQHALELAESEKSTHKRPKELVDGDNNKMLLAAFNNFRGSCCGTRGFAFMQLAAALDSVEKSEQAEQAQQPAVEQKEQSSQRKPM